ATPHLLRRLAMTRFRTLDAPAGLIIETEGETGEARAAMTDAQRTARRHGGIDFGTAPARTWYRDRFQGPYLRDPLMDRGLGVDMLDTAISWSKLPALYEAVTSALTDSMNGHGICLGHLSQAYDDGACLIFTYIFLRDRDKPVRQWQQIKS